jgi:tetratricopeptide (TPR) repeat protein
MPSRSYMVVHARRDHSLRVPRPDLSEHDDSPNACTQTGCHDQRSPAWIASAFGSLWGHRDRPAHWGTILAAGRRGDPSAPDQLASLALDDSRPAIVRASALELLGGRAPSHTERLLDDADAIVRWAAASYLTADPARLARRCDDPVRAVRMAAAVRLADVPACAHALEEYVASQGYAADMPSGPYNLGNLYVQLGRPADAEAAYRRALAIDDKLVPAAVNLALLVVRDGRDVEAERLLRAAPHVAVAEFNLGLLLAERGDRRAAEAALRDALADDPTLAAAAYNLGVLLRSDHPAEARELFRRAARLRPDEPRYVHAAAQP